MSDEQRKALYDAIDYDENADAVTVDIPREWVKMQVTMYLNKGFTIKRNKTTTLGEIVLKAVKHSFMSARFISR